MLLKNWFYGPNLSKISVKKFNFSKAVCLQPATLLEMEHFYMHIFIGLVVMRNSYFVKYLPVAAPKWIETDILLNIIITKERCEIHPVK